MGSARYAISQQRARRKEKGGEKEGTMSRHRKKVLEAKAEGDCVCRVLSPLLFFFVQRSKNSGGEHGNPTVEESCGAVRRAMQDGERKERAIAGMQDARGCKEVAV
jgi:hypothetical protein